MNCTLTRRQSSYFNYESVLSFIDATEETSTQFETCFSWLTERTRTGPVLMQPSVDVLKRDVIKNFTKPIEKHLCWSLFFKTVTGFQKHHECTRIIPRYM